MLAPNSAQACTCFMQHRYNDPNRVGMNQVKTILLTPNCHSCEEPPTPIDAYGAWLIEDIECQFLQNRLPNNAKMRLEADVSARIRCSYPSARLPSLR